MHIALAHDYLNQYGGAERVLGAFSEMFPDAPIYTLFYDHEGSYYKFAHRTIIPSFLQKVPTITRRHRFFIPLMPLAADTLRLKERYDVVLSSSAGYAKGFDTRGAYHITYCHTPLRYAWEEKEYVRTHPYFGSAPMRLVGKAAASYLRRWDAKAARRPNMYIANSRFIADKILTYYHRDARVIHPPVDEEIFHYQERERSYYLALGRMLHYKRFDLVVDAFSRLDLPLRIVGDGPELPGILKRIGTADTIEHIPFVGDEDRLRELYAGAKALLFPQVEDFGLVAAEAIMCGTPVIAYRAGGAEEIVEEGVSGVFFDEQTPEAIVKAVEQCEEKKWNYKRIARQGKRFSKSRFKKEIADVFRSQGFEMGG